MNEDVEEDLDRQLVETLQRCKNVLEWCLHDDRTSGLLGPLLATQDRLWQGLINRHPRIGACYAAVQEADRVLTAVRAKQAKGKR